MAELVVAINAPDGRLARVLRALEAREIEIHLAANSSEAVHRARVARVQAILFEPDQTGEDFINRVRREHPAQALLAWTPTSSSAMVADLFERGVDEVVHPGMTERELVARIANAARPGRARLGRPLEIGLLRLDPVHGEATWDRRDLGLTRREREVLEVLAENIGRTVRREILYGQVWGYTMARGERSVDVNVKRLRRKLAATAESGIAIKTQPGVGYRLEVVSATALEPVTPL